MTDRWDFESGQIVGARMAGVSVTKTTRLFGEARTTVLKVMTVFEKKGKPPHWSKTLENKRKLSDRDHQTHTVRRELHKAKFQGRATIRKQYLNNFL